MTRSRVFFNAPCPPAALDGAAGSEVLAFHRTFPGYEPTELRRWSELARELGVAEVLVKDESSRLGLPSFKIVGASWAVACALRQRAPDAFRGPLTYDAILEAELPDVTLLTATDGNHGHAIARLARLFGLKARILVPSNLSSEAVRAIEAEGAEVEVVDGSYDDAVRQSAQEASDDYLLVSDTSWPGYEDIPARVIEGYSTIMREVDAQLEERRLGPPDVVFVQIGVGAFAAAVTKHFRSAARSHPARIVGVEPTEAACVMASLAAGRPVEVPGPHSSIMAGLNCGLPSMLAWPILRDGIAVMVAVDDEAARDGMRRFANAGMIAGECAAAAPAGALQLLTGPNSAEHRRRLGITEESRILMFSTEGATNTEDYRRAVGDDPAVAAGP